MAYLDHNATSPMRPEAKAAMERAFAIGGNPSSVHAAGRAARALMEDARESVAALAGAKVADVVFTSGGTEANWLVLNGAIAAGIERGERFTRLFVTAVEHPSVLANAVALGERVAGLRVETIPVNADGVIDTGALRVLLREGKGRALVATMAANNETGVIQPVAEISRLVREADARLLVDAIQAAGKLALDGITADADYVSLSAHKIGGPQGVGALVVKEGAPFAAQFLGGGQEVRRRAGTQNVAGIAGFGAAADAALRDISKATEALRDDFESELKALAADVVIFGTNADRLANTSNFAIPGVSAETALMALDLDGVMVSSGAACSSGKVSSSHVLAAMGVSDALARCALRVSFGWNSTEADSRAAIAALTKLVSRARSRRAA
ncbi:MAG: aminotransferase class V-fold PLP-dependent enzyme [Alphaproteobacteria bacterium]|nr:aminotransferase class V-fold PLP-dependent enzyme [Alphaproteobacteria bacterium]